jgi:tryptophan-rich sensory protein
MQSTRRQIIGLGGWLLLSFIVSAIGAAASVQAKSFYGQLAQPAWAPPGWVFGPVWTVLYVLMAVAAWLVWRCGGFRQNRLALGFFLAQLVFNALWSWLFFGWRLLSAEMKLPGRAWLQFEVEPREGGATIRQTAVFDPVGLLGLAYWYLVYPLHRLVFARMLENIARAAIAGAAQQEHT